MIEQKQAILQREKKYTSDERPTFWYDPVAHTIIFPDGNVQRIGAMPLTSILGGIEKNMQRIDESKKSVNLFLRAGNLLKNKPTRQYFDVGDNWTRDAYEYVDTLFAKYYRAGFRVYLYGTGKYFGEEKDIVAIRKAWYTMQSQLDDTFHYPNFKLYTTPAGTGRNLLRVSLPENVQYERLSDEALRVIYEKCCYQSRIEHFTPKVAILENGVYIIDGSWFYASCLNNLPTGKCEHDTVNELAAFPNGYRCPGFYYCTATVPDNWRHIGLLKEWRDTYGKDEDSRYPNEPGETFTSWTTADELVLAISHGWHITIHERYYFPHKQTNPLYNWIRKIVELRKAASTGKAKNPLLKSAYRNIVLHTIGSFKQTYTRKNHTDITDEEFDELEKAGRIIWVDPPKKLGFTSCVEEIDLPRDRQKFVHPEWAAYIWGMVRAKLAEFALQLPYEDIVYLSTDSVWCASKPEWIQVKSEWNKPGEFVVKDDKLAGKPWEWPADSGMMRKYVIKYNAGHNIFNELMHTDRYYYDGEEF